MLALRINGVSHPFIDIKPFREAQALPESFGVQLFEPKDYAGLGRIDHAGAALNQLRENLLSQLPHHHPPQQWLSLLPHYQAKFRHQLEQINPQIGLRPPEVDFAVTGFGDVLQMVVYAAIRAQATHHPPPPFDQLYHEWLLDTLRVSAMLHPYQHQGQHWKIQVVNHAYGRVGLVVQAPDQIHYVLDSRLACPAQGFMTDLLRQTAEIILPK